MRNWLTILLLLSTLTAYSQKDYSEYYSIDEKTYSKDLTLLKIDSAHYKFWIIAAGKKFANTGDGIMGIKKGYGVYKYAEDTGSCGILFKFNPSNIEVDVLKRESLCRWDFGSHIFGKYTLIKKEKLTQADFRKIYLGPQYKVTSAKAILYLDLLCSSTKKQYFQKGDILSGTDWDPQSDKAVYIEYLTLKGKFICGWVNKSDVVEIK